MEPHAIFFDTTSSALATVPDYSDDPSGWIRVEVAIFADSNEAAMNSEVWEHAPKLGYPENRRWLTRYDEIKAFMDQWGESAVTVNTDGSLEVVPEPVIEPVLAVLADADASVESDAAISIDAHPSNGADNHSLGGYEGADAHREVHSSQVLYTLRAKDAFTASVLRVLRGSSVA